MFLDKNVRHEMSVRNALGVDGMTIMSAEQLKEKVIEFYPDEEARILSEIADDILELGELGMSVSAESAEVKDFVCMINDLIAANTDEEYDVALNSYGYLGKLESIRKYADFLRASL